MAVKAVIDTNIWVSALLNPFGFPAKVREAFEGQKIFPHSVRSE
jgi:predicted nucleic acid-binding protein